MSLPLVIFDMDDVLWPLNERCTSILGITMEQLVDYSYLQNPLLTEQQRTMLGDLYKSPSTFKDIEWYSGVHRINTIHADVRVCSNNFNRAVAEQKIEEIKNSAVFPLSVLTLRIVEEKNLTSKELLDQEIFAYVEDSPYNIAKSKAKYNIAIKKPYNTNSKALSMMTQNGTRPVYMCNTLNDAIDVVEHLLRKEQK